MPKDSRILTQLINLSRKDLKFEVCFRSSKNNQAREFYQNSSWIHVNFDQCFEFRWYCTLNSSLMSLKCHIHFTGKAFQKGSKILVFDGKFLFPFSTHFLREVSLKFSSFVSKYENGQLSHDHSAQISWYTFYRTLHACICTFLGRNEIAHADAYEPLLRIFSRTNRTQKVCLMSKSKIGLHESSNGISN